METNTVVVRVTRTERCLHCGKRQARRCGVLCNLCSKLKQVVYQWLLWFIGRGAEGVGRPGDGKRQDVPTSAYPGTPEKLAVLEYRAANGLCLWNPNDAGMATARSTQDRFLVGA